VLFRLYVKADQRKIPVDLYFHPSKASFSWTEVWKLADVFASSGALHYVRMSLILRTDSTESLNMSVGPEYHAFGR